MIKKVKHALIIGSFNRGRVLASALIKSGYKVTIIFNNIEKCKILSEMEGVTVIHGDESKPYILEDANAYNADLVIALSPKDEDNLIICELSKRKFNVRKTISVLNDPSKTDLFYKMGVDCVVCDVNAITNLIEQQALYDGIIKNIPTGDGRININEIPIFSNYPTIGKKLWELKLPKEAIIACIVRGEEIVIPRGDSQILIGDKLILISTTHDEMAAIKELTGVI